MGRFIVLLAVMVSLVSASVTAQVIETAAPQLPTCDFTSKRYTSTVPLTLIPKLRHTVWKNETLPTINSRENFGNWSLKEPHFEHVIHTDEDCLEMAKMFTAIRAAENVATSEIRFLSSMLQHLAQRKYQYNFTQVYMDYQLNVMRADVCRVLSVYMHGGIYTDLDVRHQQPVADWGVRWDTFDIVLVPENHVHVNNFMFGASPHHPCLRVALEAMLREAQDPFPFRRTKHGVHQSTGPAILTEALTSCRLEASYFSEPRTLYREEKTVLKTFKCLVKPGDFVPYTPAHDIDGVDTASASLFRVTPAFSRKHLDQVIQHEVGSVSWDTEGGYQSWTKRHGLMKTQLEVGLPVDAMGGRKLWRVVRSKDRDEKFPTLLPKKRHVVLQSSSLTSSSSLTTASWEGAEPHFTTVSHNTDNCFGMAQRYNLNAVFNGGDEGGMPDVVCGLLGLFFEGGLYMDSSICPKTPMSEWSHVGVPWSTMDLFTTSSTSGRGIGMKMIGSTPKHHCIKKALDSLTVGDSSSTTSAITEKLSLTLSSCFTDNLANIDKEWTVYYINGLKKLECLRSWVEEEGGRTLAENYKAKTGRVDMFTIQPAITDKQLFELVSLAGADGRCH